VHYNGLNSIKTTQTGLSQTSRHNGDGICPQLSPQGSFGKSRRNGIWALQSTRNACVIHHSPCSG